MFTPPTSPGGRSGRRPGPVVIPLVAALVALPLTTVARDAHPAPDGDRRTVAPDALPGAATAPAPPRPVWAQRAVRTFGQVTAAPSGPGDRCGGRPEKLLAQGR